MNKKLLKTITGIAVAGAALGAAFAYVKKCKEVNDLGEEDFDDLWDDEEEKNPEVNSCTPCRSYTTIPSDTPVPEAEAEEAEESEEAETEENEPEEEAETVETEESDSEEKQEAAAEEDASEEETTEE